MLRPFGWQAIVTVWQFAPVVTAAVVLAAGLYLWGVVRVARRHPARPWPAWRTGMFLGGLAVVVLATESGIGSYDDVLFWDHMVQHLMLIMVAPPLLIFGQPITLLLHASRNPLHTWAKQVVRSRVASFLTWPVFGFAAYAAAILAAHLTSFATLVETDETLHNAEHVLFLVVGYLFPAHPRQRADPLAAELPGPVRHPGPGYAGGHVHRGAARLRHGQLTGCARRAPARVGALARLGPAHRRRSDVGGR